MANTLEIINTISQIVTEFGHDGALTSEQEPVNIGLKREEGHLILDKRVMDGFGVKFSGDKLCINYHSDIMLTDVHDSKFESEVYGMIKDVAKFIRKEYKRLTGNALTLTETDTPIKVLVQSASRVRTWVQAEKEYKIGGIQAIPYDESETPTVDNAVKNWLAFAKGTKKPSNVKNKPSDNEKPKPYKKESK